MTEQTPISPPDPSRDGLHSGAPPLSGALGRFKLRLADWARYSSFLQAIVGTGMLAAYWGRSILGRQDAVKSLLAAARRLYPLRAGGMVERQLVREAGQSLRPSQASGGTNHEIRRGIILKAPVSPRERGVLLIAFENQWVPLFRSGAYRAIAEDYDLVLSPTWSPPYDEAMLEACRQWPRPFLTLLSNLSDADVYERWSPKLRSVPLLASSWVNADVYAPSGIVEKAYDFVVLANFSPYKRHFALFQAMAGARSGQRVLLAGVPWENHDAQGLRRLAALWGVGHRIDIAENLGNVQLRAAVQSARAALLFSKREGSCVAVAECLLQGVPVGMLASAHVGSKAFINEHTGALLGEGSRLPEDLDRFAEGAGRLEPRAWMLEHGLECRGSTAVLNRALRELAGEQGNDWTTDILAHCHVRLAPTHLEPADAVALAPLYAAFPWRYGVRLTCNVAGEPG